MATTMPANIYSPQAVLGRNSVSSSGDIREVPVDSAFKASFEARPNSYRRERLARLENLAALMDTALVIPGTHVRFGLDALVGLLPGVGDMITTAISLYIVNEARHLGAPAHIIFRMLGNVTVDGIIGAIPVAGDTFDVFFRANRRNVLLLRNWLERSESF
jgi:Domain of unknown function (DUF4112)